MGAWLSSLRASAAELEKSTLQARTFRRSSLERLNGSGISRRVSLGANISSLPPHFCDACSVHSAHGPATILATASPKSMSAP